MHPRPATPLAPIIRRSFHPSCPSAVDSETYETKPEYKLILRMLVALRMVEADAAVTAASETLAEVEGVAHLEGPHCHPRRHPRRRCRRRAAAAAVVLSLSPVISIFTCACSCSPLSTARNGARTHRTHTRHYRSHRRSYMCQTCGGILCLWWTTLTPQRCFQSHASGVCTSHGSPCSTAHCNSSRIPCCSAYWRISASHGQWCSRAHFNTCRCPPSAAQHMSQHPTGSDAPAPTSTAQGVRTEQRSAHVIWFHGQACSRCPKATATHQGVPPQR